MSTGYALFLVSYRVIVYISWAVWLLNVIIILQSYDNGRLVDTDTFFDYVELVEEPLKALLITNM